MNHGLLDSLPSEMPPVSSDPLELPELWLYALGALFIFVTLFLPKGVIGALDRIRRPKSATPIPPEKISEVTG